MDGIGIAEDAGPTEGASGTDHQGIGSCSGPPPRHVRRIANTPLIVVLLIGAVVLGGLFVVAPLLASLQPARDLRPPVQLVLTRVESQRLREVDVFQTGVWARDLRPWRPAASGIGGVSYRGADRNAFQRILDELLARKEPLTDRASVEAALSRIGTGDRAIVTYTAGIYLHLIGQNERALESVDETLGLIARARGANSGAVAAMRLDGEEIATQYLRGQILYRQGKLADAEKAFARSLEVAEGAMRYPPYHAAPSKLFKLKPEHHLVDLSTATLWADYLQSVRLQDPKRAWKIANEELLIDVDGVRTSPILAANLQLMAAERADFNLVARLDAGPNTGAEGARQAARTVAGLRSDLSSSLPADAPLLRPWLIIGEERRALGAMLSPAADIDGDAHASPEASVEDERFIASWRRQYLQALGDQFLRLGADASPAYYGAMLRAQGFDVWRRAQAAAGFLGVAWPGLVIGLVAFVWALGLLASLALRSAYLTTFEPLHHASRRFAAANPRLMPSRR